MGNLFRIIALLLTSLFVSLATILKGNPQDPVKTEKKRHIKIVKEIDGKKMMLDTLLENDEPFVWHGDTIKATGALKLSRVGKEMIPGSKENVNVYEYRISGGKDGKKLMVISSDGDEPVIMHDFAGKIDTAERIIIRKHAGKGDEGNVMIVHGMPLHERFDVPGPPPPPAPPAPYGAKIFYRGNSNIINLNDPGIIYYKKKKLKDGNEKIEIIRKEVKEGELPEIGTDVRLAPVLEHKPKIIRKEGGAVIIDEGSDVRGVKVEKMVRDGKVIQIEEINTEKGEKEVKVKVDVENEKTAPAEKKK